MGDRGCSAGHLPVSWQVTAAHAPATRPSCPACAKHGLPAAGHEHADYLVLDCNYWPGFEKTDNYVELMLQFLQDLASGRL